MRIEDINLFAPEVQEDWYPAYDALREEAPVYQMPGTNIFVLTRYEDLYAALRDTKTFSNEADRNGADYLFQHKEARQIYIDKGWHRRHPLSLDPPVQAKYRALVDPFFRGAGLKRIEPFIRETVTNLLDGIKADGAMEMNAAYAIPLPVTVITKMLGFPLEDMPQLKIWSEAWAKPFEGNLTLEQEIDIAEKGVEFQHYIKSHIDAKRVNGDDSVLSFLVGAEFEDPDGPPRPLHDEEIIHTIDHLYIGGNETTTFTLTAGTWLMLRERQVYESLKADPEKIPAFVEEALRLESPTQGLYRTVTRDVELHGVTIPKGAMVHLRYAAANRDERTFGCPHMVDLERPNVKQHMAFSQGAHTCPGAGLSRLETTISHQMMLQALPNLRLAEGKNDFTHAPGFVLRALKELHLEWDA